MSEQDDKPVENDKAMTVSPKPSDLEAIEATFISALSTALGFPVPPTMTLNVLRSIGALVSSAVGVPTAWLQGRAKVLTAEADARAELTKQVGEIAIKEIASNSELAGRATQFLGARLLREQKSREKIVADALEALKATPPKTGEDAPSMIDDDWLHLFARHAETKTNSDVQAYFARVLAGEIRKPGTFSPETIEVLARMSQETGKAFQAFCNLTMEVWGAEEPALYWESFGDPNTNSLSPVGMSYTRIGRLQDAGLVRNDLTSFFTMPLSAFFHASLAGRPLWFGAETKNDPSIHQALSNPAREHHAVRFTTAGIELRGIVHMTPNATYAERFDKWARTQNLDPVGPRPYGGSAL